MFRGISSINLDAKGRLAVPARYRSEIQESCDCQMIVAFGLTASYAPQKGCLWLYPLPEWEILEEKIMSMKSKTQKTADLQRFFVGGSTQCDMDAQGRVLLPETMKKKIGLEKQTSLVGHGKRFEIWNESIWAGMEDTWFASDELSNEEIDKGLEELDELPL